MNTTVKSTATSTPRSDAKAARRRPRDVIIGSQDSPRIAAFQRALHKAGHREAIVFDYVQYLNDGWTLDLPNEPALVRFEAPGRSFEDYKAILAVGHDEARRMGYEAIAPDAIERLQHDKGKLIAPAQYQLGFQLVLRRLAAQVTMRYCVSGDVQLLTDVGAIADVFDKRRCRDQLAKRSVPVPRALAFGKQLAGYDELRALMDAQHIPRVFIKLRFGSAASGIVAYQVSRQHELAYATVELAPDVDGVPSLYNTRRIRRYRDHRDIRPLIDRLCRKGVHVEAWYPKAGFAGRTCDLRIVTIHREPRHRVLRQSKTPFTNLHLLNQRSPVDAFIAKMSDEAWPRVLETCREVASEFQRTLHLGIDIAVHTNLRDHAVLEVNAFGDYLRGVTDDLDMTTHEAEIAVIDGLLDAGREVQS